MVRHGMVDVGINPDEVVVTLPLTGASAGLLGRICTGKIYGLSGNTYEVFSKDDLPNYVLR